MSMRRLFVSLTLTGLVAIAAPRPASADLVLGFSAPNYTINNIGETVAVAIILTQTGAGPQVGVGNALLTAAVSVTFTPSSGVADLLLVNAVGWDDLSIPPGPPNSPLEISVLSLAGISDFTNPVTVATLTFQGTGQGVVNLTVQQLDPLTPDFITELGNVLDPTNVATSSITVNAIPEPSPLGLGFLMLGAAAALRRLRVRRAA